MKYCKKCGMLLEDTHVNCIRCGADVTIAENVSMYPIEVMETIEEENQRKKASGKIVAMIIGLVIVLVGLIIFFLNAAGGMGMKKASAPAPEAKSAPEEPKAPPAEPEEPAEATPTPSNRKVKDDKGVYYDYVAETDDAGNVVFTAIIPEDLTNREFYKNYEAYDERYPFEMNFTASTSDNAVRFTYLSPRRLWYKVNDNGRARSDESDLTHFMTYFKYEGDRSYLDPLLLRSYPGAKLEVVNEYDVSPLTVSKLSDLAKEKNKQLFGSIGDYAHLGEGTTYANMDYECSAKVYEYEITLSDKNVLFAKYYIPSMAHNLSYASGSTNDRGTITEWYNYAIICLEAGNEDDYDDYADAFNMFIANALPTDLFMYLNESYSKEIQKGIEAVEEYNKKVLELQDDEEAELPDAPEAVAAADEALLKKYAADYKPGTKLDDFDSKVMDILRSCGNTAFTGTDVAVYTPGACKVAFFDKAKNKVFVSDKEDEYPGDAYEELTAETIQDAAEPSDQGANEDADADGAEADEDKDKDKDSKKPAAGVE